MAKQAAGRSVVRDGALGVVAIVICALTVIVAVVAAQNDAAGLDSNTPNGVSQPPVVKGS